MATDARLIKNTIIGDALIEARLINLENNVYKVTYYEIVSGTSGTITPPAGATFNSGEFGDSGNSILSKINISNKPTFQSPQTAGGVVVTANLNTTTGAWTTSGTYTDTSVALIYSINISAEDFSNLNNFYIIESEENVTSTLLTGYASTTGSISASDTILTAIEKLNGNIAAIPPSTLLGVSAASLTTPNSIYNLSTNIPVDFKSSGGNTMLYFDETNERIGIKTPTPVTAFDINGITTFRGNIIAGTDNTYDIGASGATRPRTGYFGTSLFSPLVVGGTSTTSDLYLQTTTGVGTTGADMHFLVGNNGATEAMTILNSGYIGIGNTTPSAPFHLKNSTTGYLAYFESTGSAFDVAFKSSTTQANIGIYHDIFYFQPTKSWGIFNNSGSGYNIFSSTNGNFTISPPSGSNIPDYAGISKLGIPTAPTASANYGLVSLGSGAFDGTTAGFYTGNANGTLIAGNLSSGSTSDLLNLQIAGVTRNKFDNAGDLWFGASTATTNNIFYYGAGSQEHIYIRDKSSSDSNNWIGFATNNSIARISTASVTFGLYSNTGNALITTTPSERSTQLYGTFIATSGIKNALLQTSSFAAAAGSGDFRPVSINYTINNSGAQSGTATGIFLNATETVLNGMTHNLMDLGTGGGSYVSKFKVNNSGLLTAYKGIVTTGWGVSTIYGAGRATAQTAANTSVSTYTVGATDGSFEVSANVLVTTSSAEAFTVTVDYTDEGNTARTITLNFQLVAGTIGTAINFANGAVPYEGIPLHIRCKASTTITIKTVGTFTGATYNVEGIIKQTA